MIVNLTFSVGSKTLLNPREKTFPMCLRSLSICQISGKFVWGLYISKCPIWTRYTPAPCPDRTLTFKNPQKLFIPPHMPGECSLVTYFTFSIADVMVFRRYQRPRAYRSPKSTKVHLKLWEIPDESSIFRHYRRCLCFRMIKELAIVDLKPEKNLNCERGTLWCRLV